MPPLHRMSIHPSSHNSLQIFTVLGTILAPQVHSLAVLPAVTMLWSICLSMFERMGATPRYPCLKTLRISGDLGGGILISLPTITHLCIMDYAPSRPNNIRDLFDPCQNAFATLVPHLSHIFIDTSFVGMIPLYEHETRAFAAARLALGLKVPIFKQRKSSFGSCCLNV